MKRLVALPLVTMSAALVFSPAYAQTSIEEVIVTARKRTETLQDIPLSVSAISGADLENQGLEDVSDLYGRIPGLYFASGSTFNSSDFYYLTIRGVGFNAGLEPAVGVFVDGMYHPQVGFDMAFLDLERLEVLRGPQGTLFGRNTQAGALNMVTRLPDENSSGTVLLELAEFDTLRAQGNVRGPIADDLFAGLSVQYTESDGYIRNEVLNQDQDFYEQIAARGTVRWTPADALELVLIGDVSQRNFSEVVRGVRLADERYASTIDNDRDDTKENSGAQLNITYDLGENIALTSISGYRTAYSDNYTDSDSRITTQAVTVIPAFPPLAVAPVPVQGAWQAVQLNQEFLSQEVRLASEHDRLDWLLGLYYFDQHMDQDRQRDVGIGVTFPFALYIREEYTEDRDGYAAFGQLSYRLSDPFELTVGARYSQENIEVGGLRILFPSVAVAPPAPVVKAGETDFENVSAMASASYDFTDDALIYFTFAQGWKAGGINRFPSNSVSVLPYEDESSDNWELGIKTRWLDDRVGLNTALFFIDIKNQQFTNFIPSPTAGGIPVSTIDTAARSEVRGAELELVAQPTENLEFDAALAYADTEYIDFTRVFLIGVDEFVMDGRDFESVPEFTASVTAAYRAPISATSELEFSLNYRYVGEIVFFDNTIGARASDQITAPSYDRLDGSISFANSNGWRLTGYVDNIFDTFDYTYISSDPFLRGDVFVAPLEPRQFGIVISKTFL